MATLTNRYVELWRWDRWHLTFSVTQFAFGFTVLIADEGTFVLIIGPLVISPITQEVI